VQEFFEVSTYLDGIKDLHDWWVFFFGIFGFFAVQELFWNCPPHNCPFLTKTPLLGIYDFLPAILYFEIFEVNLQGLAGWNVEPIFTVLVIWVVVWISGTKKSVVLHISTRTFNRIKIIFKGRPFTYITIVITIISLC